MNKQNASILVKDSFEFFTIKDKSQNYFWLFSLIALLSGLCLGCAAPGVGLWFNAWFCLAPLLVIVCLEQRNIMHADKTLLKVFTYGFLFGLAYNAIYLQWYLGLIPLDWLGFNAWQGQLLASSALLINASHQALLIAIFAVFYKMLLNGLSYAANFIKTKYSYLEQYGFTNLIQIFCVPLLWVLITNKLGNAHDFTGVPWSMLEYTQYKQLYLIQMTDTVGGIGLCFLMVMVNTIIAQIGFSIITKFQSSPAYIKTGAVKLSIFKESVANNLPALVICFLLINATLIYGYQHLTNSEAEPTEQVSIVQSNINIEMEKTKKRYSLKELVHYQLNLSKQQPETLCVWTESALPIYMPAHPYVEEDLKNFVQRNKLSLILGAIDKDNIGNAFNAAYAISSNGELCKQIYHKRYLVPFGEYTPAFVRNFPRWILSLTNTPAGSGYSSGKEPTLLNINGKLIAPLICFEIISPELAASSIRAGGQLLVNINDLAWFHQSIVGEQMIACAVLRAVENRRYCIFAANTGPSAVISSLGKIKSYMEQNKIGNLINKFNYSSKLSSFTQWYMF